MSGHSKWSTIKRKKAKTDLERGKVFTKLIREITVAARLGGGDEEANPRLRTAIEAAKAASMPSSNIERAIKKGTGELPGVNYEEMVFEGYGPGGVAIMVEATTDNRNRTVAEVRHIFERHNGNLGENGSVAWMFQQKGLITVPRDSLQEDDLLAAVLDAGAEDIQTEDDAFEITTAVEDLERVKQALKENQIQYTQAELTRVPQSTVKVDGKSAQQLLRLMDELEECDDVQRVFSNFDIEETEIERYYGESA
ncbi:MAG: transcriptional regulator [Candidatus Latescibacteria bacterium 4484_181]|nr:MAG: transcriptional regulator [Candidatus Latescibacteria bacterium 4484_181]RKY68564.1 MAG: YebC/PmpR family DNA-binding transcriptional regulator [Candidatus Latescibacterota bacterium]RKY72131.1 MAG: YebC/PmpR family DNA-binding transcriptional regulator [Candidatus Latescibacterota bacterium]